MERVLSHIKTIRKFSIGPSYKIVFEWEDIMSQSLNICFYPYTIWMNRLLKLLDILKLDTLFLTIIPRKRNISLLFEMVACGGIHCKFDKNTIPIIIDFWIEKDNLSKFYKFYKYAPLVLITSKEVYDFLKENKCPLNIEHWPLSIPDGLKIESEDKKYEFCFIGRKDPFFVDLLNRYANENPDFEFVINNDDISNREYRTNKGNLVMKDTGRESYIKIIRQSKICTYTTPGFDKAKLQSNTYNQVTPRVLEMLAGGCYILGHYPDNSETAFYNLKKVVPQIHNYFEFKEYMDLYRKSPKRDIQECINYLKDHRTSSRIPILKNILKKYDIRL